MSNKVPTTTRMTITITNHCIKIGEIVSASIENGLLNNIVVYFSLRSEFFSILRIIDQPLYLEQFVTACW